MRRFRSVVARCYVATAFVLDGCAGNASAPLPAHIATLHMRAVSPVLVTGTGSNPTLDAEVVTFMTSQRVANAELAYSKNGKVSFSHAYTFTRVAESQTSTQTIMRLASNTKAWTSAALWNLIQANKISTSAKVFQYLEITKPLPIGAKVDPRVYGITIEDMILHESGWDDSVPPFYDPTFAMREAALTLGLTHEIDLTSYVRHQLAQPLQEPPGTTYAYCNFCYTVLGMVVAKASGMSYEADVARVAASLGVSNVLPSPTVGSRLPNEVARYYSPYTGLSAVYVLSNKEYGASYSGDDMALDVAEGASELATNAESMLALMNDYLIWGVGAPQKGADWAREGSMEGSNTWAEQLPNGVNYAFLVNTRQYRDANAFLNLQTQIEGQLNTLGIPRGKALAALGS